MSFSLIQPKTRRALLSWIVIAALAFHGLIPLGYMPDVSPKAKPMQMTICNGMDMSSVDMDDEGDDNTAPAKDKADGKAPDHPPCPFSVNAIFTFAKLTPDLTAQIFLFIAVVSFATFMFAAQRRYINASPRAPPFPA